jgi:hypothetical protein
LWKLPVQKSAPSSAGASISAGAWAPSTIVGTSRVLHSSTNCRIGNTIAVAELIWSTIKAAVRLSRAAPIVATTVASSASSGTSTTTTSAWFARANRSAAYSTAPYAWLVSTIRLPGRIGRAASAAVTPALAFGTRAKPAGSVRR